VLQLHAADLTFTIYKFYMTDKNLAQPILLLQGKVKLLMDPAGLRHYCPGQPPLEKPAYISVCIFIGHMIPFLALSKAVKPWLGTNQMMLTLSTISR